MVHQQTLANDTNDNVPMAKVNSVAKGGGGGRFPRRQREDYIEDRFRGITLGRGSCIMTNARGSDGVGVGGVALWVGGVEVALRSGSRVGVQSGVLEMLSSVNKIKFVTPLPPCKKYKGLLICLYREPPHPDRSHIGSSQN